MKSESRIRRVKLRENHHHESLLLGIVTSEPDYKLCISINNKLAISLRSLYTKSGPEHEIEMIFSRYSFSSGFSDIVYTLISNRSGKQYLSSKLKNIDYFLLIQNPEPDTDITYISQKIKEIESVTALFSLDPVILEDKNLRHLIP